MLADKQSSAIDTFPRRKRELLMVVTKTKLEPGNQPPFRLTIGHMNGTADALHFKIWVRLYFGW